MTKVSEAREGALIVGDILSEKAVVEMKRTLFEFLKTHITYFIAILNVLDTLPKSVVCSEITLMFSSGNAVSKVFRENSSLIKHDYRAVFSLQLQLEVERFLKQSWPPEPSILLGLAPKKWRY